MNTLGGPGEDCLGAPMGRARMERLPEGPRLNILRVETAENLPPVGSREQYRVQPPARLCPCRLRLRREPRHAGSVTLGDRALLVDVAVENLELGAADRRLDVG